MAKKLDMLSKSLQENLDLTAFSQVGHTHNYAGSSTVGGAATSATKLATARIINGTSFDGSGDITTANWGTARTLTIGNSGKSVNGSVNVSWTLTEIGAAPTSHTHNYAGSSSVGGAANSVKTNLMIKLNSGTTEGTNLFTFNGSTAKTVNITPSAIGAADISHGPHVTYSTTTPKVAGTATVGSESAVARGDHVHPAQTSVSGNAGTATKLATAKSIQIGNKSNTFDGTDNITYTLADIGAATSGHTHSTLIGVSGSSWSSATRNITDDCKFEFASHINKDVTGKFPCANNANAMISFNKHSGNYESQLGFSSNGNIYYRSANGTALTDSTAWQTIYTSANKPTPTDIGAAAESHGTHVTYSTTTPLVAGTASVGSANNVARGDHVHPAQTSVSGNAGTATKLQSAKSITIGNKANNFDGSANITYTLAQIGAFPAAGGTITGATTVQTTSTAPFAIQRNANTDEKVSMYVDDSVFTMHYLNDETSSSMKFILENTDEESGEGAGKNTAQVTFTGSGGKSTVAADNFTEGGTALSSKYAKASHGTHVTYASAVPLANGTAAVGASAKVAREDHVHPLQTSVSGNAGTATTLQTARTITIGSTGKTFNGSENVSWTLSEIGAAASNHKHGLLHDDFTIELANTTTDSGWSMINSNYNGYLLKSLRTNVSAPNWICNNYAAGIAFGGSDTKGVISTAYNSPSIKFAGGNGTKPVWWIGLTGTTGTSYNLANFENKNHGTHVTYATTTPKANGTAAVGSSAEVARADHVHPLQTSVSGNAGTATKLATARTLTIGSTGKTFDGSDNVSWTLSEIGAAASSHTHTSINYQDTRAVNTTANDVPSGLSVHLKSNGTDGISDGGSYHPVLMMKPWNDKSGWPIGQLTVTQNNNLYFRVSSGADDTSWNAWKKVSLDGHTHDTSGTVTAVASDLTSVTINSYDSIMSSINTNINNLG